MSKSKRKPYVTEGYGGFSRGFYKRLANKKTRKSNNVRDGMMYKKIYCSWDICDYKWYLDKDEEHHEKMSRK